MSDVCHPIRNCAVVALLVLNSFNLFAADNLKPIEIQMSRDVKLEFQPCPAGTYTMGKENDTKEGSCTKSHKVTITRPFWMGKYKITHAQWNRISEPANTYKGKSAGKSKDKKKNKNSLFTVPYEKIPVNKVSYIGILDFCKHLNRRYKAKLPKGYVLRLPTEAEWEYACMANADDFADPYVSYMRGSYAEKMEAAESIMFDEEEFDRWLSKSARLNKEDQKWALNNLLYPVGCKKPNKWGIFDMIGNGAEIMLDTIVQLQKVKDKADYCIYPVSWGERLKYPDEETDPVQVSQDEYAACIIRGLSYGYKKKDPFEKVSYPVSSSYDPHYCFRLCIGPDLVTEKKAERAKNKKAKK